MLIKACDTITLFNSNIVILNERKNQNHGDILRSYFVWLVERANFGITVIWNSKIKRMSCIYRWRLTSFLTLFHVQRRSTSVRLVWIQKFEFIKFVFSKTRPKIFEHLINAKKVRGKSKKRFIYYRVIPILLHLLSHVVKRQISTQHFV